MRCIVGVLFVFVIFSLGPAAAQSPLYRRPGPAQEQCPQGRQIRAQKAYPATMTDCEVLDADTAAENQKLQRKPSMGPVTQQPAKLPAPKPATAAATPPAPTTALPSSAIPPPANPQPPAGVLPITAQAPVPRAVPAEPLRSDYEGRMIGNWMTSAKEDRFGDGGTFVAATGDDGIVLAVRCLQKSLSIGIIEVGDDPKPVEKGDLFCSSSV
jgi:hypothetical protein